jgi:anti-sigma B factor antagonist
MGGGGKNDLLEIVVTPGEGEVMITLTGELDMSTAPSLRDQLHLAIESGALQLICNMANLRYIDSTGLTVLLMTHKRMASIGGSLVLQSPAQGARRLFEIAGVAEYLVIDPSEPLK